MLKSKIFIVLLLMLVVHPVARGVLLPADWFELLIEAEEGGTPLEFLASLSVPKPYIVVIAWDASPIHSEDLSVGHMAIKIGDDELGVWPNNPVFKDEDSWGIAVNRSLKEDVADLGEGGNFLVLRLEDDEYSAVIARLGSANNSLSKGIKNFSIGGMVLSVPLDKEVIEVPLSNTQKRVSSGLKAIQRIPGYIMRQIIGIYYESLGPMYTRFLYPFQFVSGAIIVGSMIDLLIEIPYDKNRHLLRTDKNSDFDWTSSITLEYQPSTDKMATNCVESVSLPKR